MYMYSALVKTLAPVTMLKQSCSCLESVALVALRTAVQKKIRLEAD